MSAAALLLLVSCSPREPAVQPTQETAPATPGSRTPEIKSVELTRPLNPDWVKQGKSFYDSKCMPCHRLTTERLVGPGWRDVTRRRTPVWILNMICNTDKMLAHDAEALKLLERCLVRMPNQNIPQEEARKILEFMRKNDGET